MSDIENKKLPTTIPVVDGFSGYDDRTEGEDRPQGGGIIKGMLVKFTNDATWIDTNENALPADLELVVIDVIRLTQKWIDQKPVETRILAPGEKFPDIGPFSAAHRQVLPRARTTSYVGPRWERRVRALVKSWLFVYAGEMGSVWVARDGMKGPYGNRG
jgi:hypothetical protein